MDVVNQEPIPYQNQVALDFADQLPSGYRFCPTDSELIVDCLSAKMESRELPPCRLHEVNIYTHKPQQLAERYRSSENTWYFLTPRDRKYPNGNRPDRAVRAGGFWKASQKYKPVNDAPRHVVGYKRSLVFYENKDHRTNWLMVEYTITEPNLPFENQENGNKLNEWVLCKIYKKKEAANSDDDGAKEVGNIKKPKKVIKEPKGTRDHDIPLSKIQRASEKLYKKKKAANSDNDGAKEVGNIKKPKKVITNPKGTRDHDIPLSKRRRASENTEIRTNTNPIPNPMQTMTTFQDSNLMQPAQWYQNTRYLFPDGASTSGSSEPPTSDVQRLDYGCYTSALTFDPVNYHIPQQNVQNSNQDPKTQLNVQSGSDHIPQPIGDNASISPLDADTWSIFDDLDPVSFNYLQALAIDCPIFD